MTDAERLFVYGTLRRGAGGPREVRRLLERHCVLLGEGRMEGILYDAGGFPAAVSGPGSVAGEVLRVESPGPVFRALDRYEGAGRGERSLYRRRRVEVEMADRDRALEAWTYLYARSTAELPRIPSGDYLRGREG